MLERGHLTALSSDRTTRLRTLIAGASRTTLGLAGSAGGALALQRPGGAPSALSVVPLEIGTSRPERHPRATALLLIDDPDSRPGPAAEIIRALYGRAGAAVATALAVGHSISEIAERHRVAKADVQAYAESTFLRPVFMRP